VTVSGKIRGQRAKSMKFVDGLMIHSGNPVNDYIQGAVRHVLLRQGVLGLKVKIMLPHDPKGLMGPMKPLPDNIIVAEPKDDKKVDEPYSENKEEKKVCNHRALPKNIPDNSCRCKVSTRHTPRCTRHRRWPGRR
jgi:small subunit ribosomal protein S3e